MAAAIRGQSSAHSLVTGPLTAEPFISPCGLTMTPALSELRNASLVQAHDSDRKQRESQHSKLALKREDIVRDLQQKR